MKQGDLIKITPGRKVALRVGPDFSFAKWTQKEAGSVGIIVHVFSDSQETLCLFEDEVLWINAGLIEPLL